MPNLYMQATYELVFERKPSLIEIMSGLREYDLADTIVQLASINNALAGETIEKQREVAAILLSPKNWDLVGAAERQARTPLVPFHRQQLLFAMRLLALSSDGTGTLSTRDDQTRYRLGELLLMISDLCSAGEQTDASADLIGEPTIGMQEVLASILLQNEAVSLTMPRYWDLLFRYVPKALGDLGLPLDSWSASFERAYGCKAEDVFAICVLMYTILQSQRSGVTNGVAPTFEEGALVQLVKWDRNRLMGVLSHLSMSIGEIGPRLMAFQNAPQRFDFSLFRNKPLVLIDGKYTALDRGFLQDLAGEQLVRQMRTTFAVDDQQNLYGSVLGKAFESYFSDLLEMAYPVPEALVNRKARPELDRGNRSGKAADAEVESGAVRTFIEAKGVLLTDHAKFSSVPSILGEELYRTYARDAGIAQLADYAAKEQTAAQSATTNQSAARRFQPVLVGLDNALSSPTIQATLRRRFIQRFTGSGGVGGYAVAPWVERLVVLSCSELEMIIEMVMGGASLVNILDEITSKDPQGVLAAKDILVESRYRVLVSARFRNERWRGLTMVMAGVLGRPLDATDGEPRSSQE